MSSPSALTSPRPRVQEFQNKFARPDCAVEASRFLPRPQRQSRFQKRARSGATLTQTTNNQREQTNEVAQRCAINVSCCSRSDKLCCVNESGQPRQPQRAKADLTPSGDCQCLRLHEVYHQSALLMTIAHYRARQAVKEEIRARSYAVSHSTISRLA